MHTREPVEAKAHHEPAVYRGTILLGLSFFAFIAWIIAMCTDIAWADQSNGQGFTNTSVVQRETHVDTWFTCINQDTPGVKNPPLCFRNNDDQLGCQEYKDRFRVVQSFLVMVGIFLLVLMICSALDRFALLSDVQHAFGPRAILVGLCVIVVMFSVVSFGVAFSIPKTQLCDADEFEHALNFTWGPSPFFTALICLLCIIGAIVAAVKDGYRPRPVTVYTVPPPLVVQPTPPPMMVHTQPRVVQPTPPPTVVHTQPRVDHTEPAVVAPQPGVYA